METTEYRSHVQDEPSPTGREVCDMVQLLTVPCIPLGRAASMAGWSTCAIALVSLTIAVLYVGSLAIISIYWIQNTPILGSLYGAVLPFLGCLCCVVFCMIAFEMETALQDEAPGYVA